MKFALALVFLIGPALAAQAGEITSAYTSFDLDKCKQTEPPDDTVFEGTWTCKGYGGLDIVYSGEDARSYVSFGRNAEDHCTGAKTFYAFNTALSPVEWRLEGGKPFATIERWSTTDGEGAKSTWLVVTALRDDDSCPIAYVSGSYPEANAVARKAADENARNFSCADDVPKLIAEGSDPPIELKACRAIEGLSYE
jgi:hypothetical protein